jgi:N-acetylneuraminic acid mutarotase
VGLPDANLFDPEKVMWSGQDDGVAEMTFSRWYPTSTTLPDGRILTVSGSERRCDGGDHNGEICTSHAGCSDTHGSCVNDVCDGGDQDGNACGGNADCLNNTGTCDDARIVDIPEIYDPATQSWTSLVNSSKRLPFYPLMFLLPDGKIFYAGAENEVADSISTLENYVLDLDANPASWTKVATSMVNGGSGVMYEPGKILKSGGRNGNTALDGAQTIDLNQQMPSWKNTLTPMSARRVVHSSTLLPDGTVLVTGGTRFYNREYNHLCVGGTRKNEECSPVGLPPGDADFVCTTGDDEENCPGGSCTGGDGMQQWVSQAELYNPATDAWTTLASMVTPRQYHSNAMLLPDGRVVVVGGGLGGGAIHNYLNYEIFSPPYEFNGAGPTITNAPPWFSPGD